MLSVDQNEFMTRTAPSTPMGQLFRKIESDDYKEMDSSPCSSRGCRHGNGKQCEGQ
jgi:hypothetical protein